MQRVHSVGVPREPAGGVVEAAVRLDRLFAGVGLPFDGEVPVELRGGPAPFFVLAARWRGRARFPRAGDRGMAIPAVEDLEKEGDVERCDDDDGHGCRSSGTVDRRLPVSLRGCFDPRRQRAAANSASPARPRRRRSRVAEGLGCNFLFCVDLSVIWPF